MTADATDEKVLRRFLLGELGEEVRESIEERLMTDEAYFEEYELIKEGVIDEYVEGEMTADERKKFEKHFLTSASRHREGSQEGLKGVTDRMPFPRPTRF